MDNSGNESLPTTEVSATPFDIFVVRTVKKDGSGDYTQIDAAITDAANGDTIKIYAGVYEEQVITSKNIHFIGEDSSNTIISWENGGVFVMARPPGKRNSNIHLLSGGEKALTAVALLFSIFELNPAPFCLLDEVDAPLDDTNVGRFCDIVKEMSSSVQFVVITHNKKTMELTKQLIGVTMSEPGVSRLVSVDIDEAVEMSEEQIT